MNNLLLVAPLNNFFFSFYGYEKTNFDFYENERNGIKVWRSYESGRGSGVSENKISGTFTSVYPVGSVILVQNDVHNCLVTPICLIIRIKFSI